MTVFNCRFILLTLLLSIEDNLLVTQNSSINLINIIKDLDKLEDIISISGRGILIDASPNIYLSFSWEILSYKGYNLFVTAIF